MSIRCIPSSRKSDRIIREGNKQATSMKVPFLTIVAFLLDRNQPHHRRQSKTCRQNSNDNNSNPFDDWISDARHEVLYDESKFLKIEGTIPDCLQGGIYIRNGAAQWKSNHQQQQQMFSHIFDGLAKVSMYEILDDDDHDKQHQIRFATRFIRSKWYHKINNNQQHQQAKRLPIAFGTGPVITKKNETLQHVSVLNIAEAISNTMFFFDNTPVNVWDMDPTNTKQHNKTIVANTDAPIRSVLKIPTLETVSTQTITSYFNFNQILHHGIEFFSTAHPLYSLQQQQQQSTSSIVSTYNVGVQIGWNDWRARVGLIRETPNGQRTFVAQREIQDGIPYIHSFGITKQYAVIVLQPLRLNLNPIQWLQKGFFRSMKHVDQTRILIFDLNNNGQCVFDQSTDEKIFFYHSISTCETQAENNKNTIVSIRLCAYKTPEIITGEDQFMRLEKCQGSPENRNRISKGGTICDIACNLYQNTVTVRWMASIRQGFELPTTRYSRNYGPSQIHHHPRFVYAFGAYANGSSEYDDWGLFKFDTQTESIAACYQEKSTYVSEPIFVPSSDDDDDVEEDDGVLLSQIYDGIRRETALLILDAKNMKVLAKAYTGQRSPMDFHGIWIPRIL